MKLLSKLIGGLRTLGAAAKVADAANKAPAPSKKFRMNALSIVVTVLLALGGSYLDLDGETIVNLIALLAGQVAVYTGSQAIIDVKKVSAGRELLDAIQELMSEKETAQAEIAGTWQFEAAKDPTQPK